MHIQNQVESALKNERKEKGKRDTVKALVVVFVVIPLVVIAAAFAWHFAGNMGLFE